MIAIGQGGRIVQRFDGHPWGQVIELAFDRERRASGAARGRAPCARHAHGDTHAEKRSCVAKNPQKDA